MDLTWREGAVREGAIRSRSGSRAVVRSATRLKVTSDGRPVRVRRPEPGVIVFDTARGATYRLHQ
ncbi:glycoside hydrolase family 95-like protein [Streptomyces lincolnensis]|uniref:glycoside hydrolase family 95-like protein n=1 Tax=Streptomyces lincolnensis TaxID=1915 RepID=UPI00082A12FC|nr:hypothetical protein [Streptomyces lincolnensis]